MEYSVTPDMEDDLALLMVLREMMEKEFAPADADPSIFAPWGTLSYPEGYKSGKCNRPD